MHGFWHIFAEAGSCRHSPEKFQLWPTALLFSKHCLYWNALRWERTEANLIGIFHNTWFCLFGSEHFTAQSSRFSVLVAGPAWMKSNTVSHSYYTAAHKHIYIWNLNVSWTLSGNLMFSEMSCRLSSCRHILEMKKKSCSCTYHIPHTIPD